MNEIFNFTSINHYFQVMIELEIGKILIKNLVSVTKPYTSICEIREYGIQIIEGRVDKSSLDLDEKIYMEVLIYYHKGILKEIPTYIPILLDSTASGQQILAKLCKVSDPEILKTLNLYQNKV